MPSTTATSRTSTSRTFTDEAPVWPLPVDWVGAVLHVHNTRRDRCVHSVPNAVSVFTQTTNNHSLCAGLSALAPRGPRAAATLVAPRTRSGSPPYSVVTSADQRAAAPSSERRLVRRGTGNDPCRCPPCIRVGLPRGESPEQVRRALLRIYLEIRDRAEPRKGMKSVLSFEIPCACVH
jgi:hypothetical protein